MDSEKKIEMPFGAFDSELVHQEINIPKGFKAVIDGNKIILTRVEREDEKVRKALAEMVHDTTGDSLWIDYNVHKEEALAWLEKQGEQNPAWSEEDEEFLSEIISDIKFAQDKHPDSQMNQIIFDEEVTWLKSLKDRVGNFDDGYKVGFSAAKHNQWKPSDKQMDALDSTLQYSQVSHNSFEQLNSLFNDLKKLREE